MYRLGDKTKIANKIIGLFPDHSIYIESFFGIGGIYFNKPNIASINLLNDFDSNIHLLYYYLKNNNTELIDELIKIPITEDTFKYLKEIKTSEPLTKLIRFIYLSSFSLYGKGSSIMTGNIVKKESVIKKLEDFLKGNYLQQATFYNKDFRSFIKSLSFVENQKSRIFMYQDPPYLNTLNNYETPKWVEQDLIDLIEYSINTGFKFAISEFKNENTIRLFNKYNLNIIDIQERHNIKKSDTEILACNYQPNKNFLNYI